jgi:hypothetical protein
VEGNYVSCVETPRYDDDESAVAVYKERRKEEASLAAVESMAKTCRGRKEGGYRQLKERAASGGSFPSGEGTNNPLSRKEGKEGSRSECTSAVCPSVRPQQIERERELHFKNSLG